ncbi:MAG: hypothetical protein GC161_17755 [Planctomycetaceae bacterium]|nr:hypothetical protein [Planctomycetaceae bacterium]
MKTTLATAAALLAASLSPAEAQNRVLLLPGQTLPSAGTIANVGEFAMNSHGSWVGLVQTDLPTPVGFGVLVRDGQPLFVPDGLTLGPSYSTSTSFLDLDDQGNIGYTALNPATGDWHLMRNTTTVLKRGELVDVDNDGVAEPVTGFRAVHLAKDGSGALYAVLFADGDHHLVRILRTGAGALETQVVLTHGQVLPSGATVSTFDIQTLRYRSQLASNAGGDLAFALPFKGVFQYGLAGGTLATVAKHDDPSPFANFRWAIDVNQSVALSDAGDVFFPNELAGNGESLDVLAQDQQAVLFQGQPLDFPSGQAVGDITTSRSVRVSAKGEVLWAGFFQNAAGTVRPGLARDGKVVVLAGTTRVEGHIIDTVVLSLDGGHNFTADGERILFRGRTAEGDVGIFEVHTTPTVEVIAGCTPKLAALVPFGGQGFALGQPFQPALQLTGPQAAGALSLLFLSPLGTVGCGTLVPGLGEVLVSLQPELLFVSAPVDDPGASGLFVLPSLPQTLAFQGLAIHAQGAWVHTASAFEPVRLSNAIRFVVGL